MSARVKGKVALVSGGAGENMGSAICRRVAEEGAAVIIADIYDDKGTSLGADLRRKGWRANFIHADATSYSDQEAAVAASVAEFGSLDIFHAHGIGRYRRGYVSELTPQDWDDGMR